MTDPHDQREHGEHGEHDEHEHGHDDHHHHEHRPMSYEEEVAAFRDDKDEFFRESPHSPIPEGERAGFTGLPYYPISTALRFEELVLERYDGDQPTDFQIPTSDDRLRPAHRAGLLRFDVEGARQALTAYTFDGGDGRSLFVPFLDSTSGKETYGAGRYLDLEPEDDGTYALDFNLAYHPSCVYDPKYSCPLTPAENRLQIRIEAGERLSPDG